MNEKEIQETVLRARQIEEQLNALTQEMNLLNNSLTETLLTKRALEEIKKVAAGKETLIPIGSGVLIKAKSEKNDKVIMGAGEGVYLEKPVEEVIKDLEKRETTIKHNIQEFSKAVDALRKEYTQLVLKIEEYRKKLNKVS